MSIYLSGETLIRIATLKSYTKGFPWVRPQTGKARTQIILTASMSIFLWEEFRPYHIVYSLGHRVWAQNAQRYWSREEKRKMSGWHSAFWVFLRCQGHKGADPMLFPADETQSMKVLSKSWVPCTATWWRDVNVNPLVPASSHGRRAACSCSRARSGKLTRRLSSDGASVVSQLNIFTTSRPSVSQVSSITNNYSK